MTYSLTKLALEECLEQLIDYRGKTPKKTESGIPLITAKVIKNGNILPPTEFIAENDYDSWMRRGIPKEGDVVLTVEAPLGEVAQLDSRKIALAQRVITLRGKKDLLNNTFLKYLLMSNAFQSALNGRASGTTVLGIKQSELRKIQLSFPPLSIQNKIANILSTLDDKIELNKKINQTLESIAQTIFKSWFVDFYPVHAKANASSEDEYGAIAKELGISREILNLFPSEFEGSELGLIPKGWSVESFAMLASMKTKSIKPYEYPEKVWMSYSIPAFDSNCYPEFCLGSEIKSNKYKVENEAILVSKLNPTTPRIWLPHKKNNDAICSTEFMQFLPKNIKNRSYIYCLINSEYFQNEIKSRVTGTTGSRQRAQPKEVAVIPVINPPSNLVDKFSIITCQLLEQTLSNREESNNLKKLQQLLLPKLLSGEIDVSNLNLEPEHD